MNSWSIHICRTTTAFLMVIGYNTTITENKERKRIIFSANQAEVKGTNWNIFECHVCNWGWAFWSSILVKFAFPPLLLPFFSLYLLEQPNSCHTIEKTYQIWACYVPSVILGSSRSFCLFCLIPAISYHLTKYKST